jgi:hypothetical protein
MVMIERLEWTPGPAPEGCTCRDAPGWYPGRPAAELCPLHASHAKACPSVRLLGLSWRSEGCGWRCPGCGATWTLTRLETHPVDHVTPYGTHPRSTCGPAFCDLLPPRPTMHWVRDGEPR